MKPNGRLCLAGLLILLLLAVMAGCGRGVGDSSDTTPPAVVSYTPPYGFLPLTHIIIDL